MGQEVISGGSLLVAVQETFALVKVTGRATFKLAPSLRRFCSTALGGGCNEVIFDMEECFGMDSSFMGVLAGIAIRPPTGSRSIAVVIVNLTPKTHAMLTTLGLEPILECHEQNEAPTALKKRLQDALHLNGLNTGESNDPALSLSTMLQAHQHLVDVNPENMARFRDVLTYLEQEMLRNENE